MPAEQDSSYAEAQRSTSFSWLSLFAGVPADKVIESEPEVIGPVLPEVERRRGDPRALKSRTILTRVRGVVNTLFTKKSW
jgi:hypothetical protein